MRTAREPRVEMVTGAYPPEVCGVGDYTARLMAAAPAGWHLFTARRWSWRDGAGLVRRLLARRPDAVIVQYPTQGYGWSLVPHLLAVVGRATGRYRTALALHEFTSLSRKARAALAIASHAAAHVVFTTDAECEAAQRHPLFARRVPASVIPILSNIPAAPALPAYRDRTIDLAYFGHIRPNKGVEEFLDVMAAVRRDRSEVRVAMIGAIPPDYAAFGDAMLARCREIGVEPMLGLDDASAARTLADVRLLYLPFRDGVSARRGTVLAGIGNGAIVATRVGAATPTALLPAIIACSGTPDDVAPLRDAIAMPPATAARLQEAGARYLDAMLPRDWSAVARRYEAVVASMLDGDALVASRTDA